MTGVKLHQALAAELPEVAATMVFMTGGWFGDEEAAFLRRDDVTCLAKPLGVQELRESVRQFLERRPAA